MVCLENIFVHEICTPDNVLNRCIENMDSFSRPSKIAHHISIRVGNEESCTSARPSMGTHSSDTPLANETSVPFSKSSCLKAGVVNGWVDSVNSAERAWRGFETNKKLTKCNSETDDVKSKLKNRSCVTTSPCRLYFCCRKMLSS